MESLPPWDDQLEAEHDAEVRRWRRWRWQGARDAGLTSVEASLFADSTGNLALLRNAAEHGATHDQLVHIFI